jgi:hypothetical protein
MSSGSRPSSRPRQTWRERSRREPTAESRSIKRWFSSLLFLCLVAALGWLIWRYAFASHTYYAVLSVQGYTRHAVPPVPYFENDARFFEDAIRCETLQDSQTRKSMGELAVRLDKIVPRRRDVLVLYVSAHGVSLASGGQKDAYLLCADFNNTSDRRHGEIAEGCFKVADFLTQVGKCQAGVKLVILDAGHLPTEPRLGVLVNEFPTLLAAAVEQTGDPGLWVLTANGIHESSHVAHSAHQSVFNHYVVRGLAGDADCNPVDRLVDLAELTAFVNTGVVEWMRAQYAKPESQTPQLLWGGGKVTPAVIKAQMREVVLTPAGRSRVDDGPQAKSGDAPKTANNGARSRDSRLLAENVPTGAAAARRSSNRFDLLPLAVGAAVQVSAEPPADAGKPAAQATAGESKAPDAPPTTDAAATKQAQPPAPDDGKKAEPAKATAQPDAAEPKDRAAVPAPSETKNRRGGEAGKAAKDDRQREPAADAGSARWKKLREAWQERARLLEPSGDGGWTPYDYAPQAWRRYEGTILDFEARTRARIVRKGDSDQPLAAPQEAGRNATQDVNGLAEVRELARRFMDSRRAAEKSGPLHDALQFRNRAIYRTIDLVAWHSRANCGLQQKLREFQDIANLLDDLTQLDDQLIKATAERGSDDAAPSGAPSQSEPAEALLASVKRTRDRLDAMESALLAQTRAAIREVSLDPNGRGAARRIEDLLSIPLGDASLRVELAEALERGGLPFERVDVLKTMAARSPGELIELSASEARSQADENECWSRALERAQLESALVRLVDAEAARKLDERVASAADVATKSGRAAVGALGADLGDFYRGLPGRIKRALQNDPPELLLAEREIRLLPPAALDSFVSNPIVELHWASPAARGFEFDGFEVADSFLLAPSSEWKPLAGRLDAKGEFAGDVRISIHYDPTKIEVDTSDGDRLPVKPDEPRVVNFGPSHAFEAIGYQIRRAQLEPRQTAEFAVTATATDGSGLSRTWKIACEAPPPDAIDILVSPAEIADDPGEAGRAANDSLVAGRIAGRPTRAAADQLFTYPGHATSFVFRLRHLSERKRNVSVDLFGIDETDESKVKLLRQAAESGANDFLIEASRAGSRVNKLSSVKKMTLLAEDQDGTPVDFPQFPPPAPADAKEAKSPPPPSSIVGGLVTLVRDLDDPDLGPWVTWIDVQPWGPWHYIAPTVSYDGNKQLSVRFELRDKARPQDGKPIRVSFEESKDLSQERFEISETTLNKENRYTSRLDAAVPRDPTRQVEVNLNVDGYPRAFVYKIPIDSPSSKDKNDWERSLAEIKIVEPRAGTAIRPGDDVLQVKLHVSAPDTSFFRRGGDRVEVGIDKTGNDGIDEKFVSYTDRKHVLAIKEIGSGGRLTINTEVSDLAFPLRVPSLNKRAQLVARLLLRDRQPKLDRIEIVFDQTAPTMAIDPREVVVRRGGTATFFVTADDAELSGIKWINYVLLDKPGVEKIDDELRKNAKQVKFADPQTGKYLVGFKPADDLAAGTHFLLVWATDNVGLESRFSRVAVVVKEKPETVAPTKKAPAATTGTIRGKVVYGKDPVAGATVSIVEGMGATMVVKKSATTDGKGEFAIADLPPGDYKLHAEGKAKNNLRKSPITPVVMPMPPRVVSDVTIKLQ